MANRLAAWFRRVWRDFQGVTAEEYIGVRTSARTQYSVSPDTAMRNSAVWACLRLRADLISTFPVDAYRKIPGLDGRFDVPRPQFLKAPGGPLWDLPDWLYATQVDLDRCGNAFGLITERDGFGFPLRIDLVSASSVTVVQQANGKIIYRIGNTEYSPDEVWHERQYVVAGSPVGLSPVAYAASVISEGQATSDFAQTWFSRGAVPSALIKNTEASIDPELAETVKKRFLSSVRIGEPFVVGSDWEYSPLQAEQMGMEWLEDRKFTLTDISRFFGVPSDLIDAAVSGESVTYANLTERNLQFLAMHLGPVMARREKNISKILAGERYIKFNPDSLLRMDPLSRAKTIALQLEWKYLTNDEARALEDREPLTQAEKDQMSELYGAQGKSPLAIEGIPDDGSQADRGREAGGGSLRALN